MNDEEKGMSEGRKETDVKFFLRSTSRKINVKKNNTREVSLKVSYLPTVCQGHTVCIKLKIHLLF